MRKLSAIICILLSLILASAVVGCVSSNSPGTVTSSTSTLVVGCDDYSPFTYNDENGNMTGIDVEILTQACARIGYQAEFKHIDWEKKNDLLSSGDIDCIASCFSMTGRESQYRWAGPYMKSRQVVAVSPESEIKTMPDLKGKIIAVRSTSKPESIILDNGNDILSNVKNVFSFADRSYLIPALLKGYVNAIASHETAILQYEKDYEVDLRILDEPLLETGVGFAFDPDDKRGVDAQLKTALDDMRADGTMKQILSRYLDNPDSCLDLVGLDG